MREREELSAVCVLHTTTTTTLLQIWDRLTIIELQPLPMPDGRWCVISWTVRGLICPSQHNESLGDGYLLNHKRQEIWNYQFFLP